MYVLHICITYINYIYVLHVHIPYINIKYVHYTIHGGNADWQLADEKTCHHTDTGFLINAYTDARCNSAWYTRNRRHYYNRHYYTCSCRVCRVSRH